MTFLRKADKVLVHCEEFISAISMLLMCIVVFASVVCRYFLAFPFPASEEMARYLMVYCIYIGVSIATRKKAHIGVDVFIDAFPDRVTKVFRMLAQVISIATFAWLFVLAVMWIDKSIVPDPQRTPLTRIPYWYLYLSIAIGFALSVLRGIQVFFKDFIFKTGAPPEDGKLAGKEVSE